MLVSKFGGSSLSNSTQFCKVRNIITDNSDRRVIVLSAPGKRNQKDTKITDLLYHCCTRAVNNQSFQAEFDKIKERFNEIALNCNIKIDLESEFEEIKKNIIETQSSDYTASRGEYLSAKLMSLYLGYSFVDATDLIFFNESGDINEEKTYLAIRNAVIEHTNIVIPGFYGSMPSGEIKTFTRGGSDITGAIAAAAVNACLYENWTDVSGILMADPRIVENPNPIKNITYSELRALAHMGASVLHEDAVFPVRQAGIPLNIRNTNSPEVQGTIICDRPVDNARSITGISGKRDFSILSVRNDNISQGFVNMKKALQIMENFFISVENVVSNQEGFSIVVPSDNLQKNEHHIIDEFTKFCPKKNLNITHSISLISVVGKEIRHSSAISGYLLNVLDNKRITVRSIHHTADRSNVIVGVSNNDFEKTINVLYNSITAMAM